jgi:hypothetical protein
MPMLIEIGRGVITSTMPRRGRIPAVPVRLADTLCISQSRPCTHTCGHVHDCTSSRLSVVLSVVLTCRCWQAGGS